ncbi:SBBP repeat-containing protein [Nannocystis pusilla]|uniref:SBBP repeat-containing protein n=1 Tax=Nannocystis pusilla TaxID=889268 RepID=A0ABS7TQG6_9BACT|nr:SBBP repeat-containing protein [Nannocystis pusilla]MBZ5710469.1 SBBP repeat-containing protein [Nannocystis pusilla]
MLSSVTPSPSKTARVAVLALTGFACTADGGGMTSPDTVAATDTEAATSTGEVTSTLATTSTTGGEAPTTTELTTDSGPTSGSTTMTEPEPSTDTNADPAVCGDGVVEGDEECDDGDADNDDACLADCTDARCGDGHVGPGESCDDGNGIDDDGCNNACAPPNCGDGQIGGDEACDDGNDDNTDACLNNCVAAGCGDGVVWAGVEACDDGDGDDDDACLHTCVAASCGDGVVWAGVEACDDGNGDNTDACLDTCAAASCGDGHVGPGEGCDDGNAADDDGCSNVCAPASCGDGQVDAGEACDDGNADDSDACLDTCAAASCGDGFVWAGVEACDDGNADDTDACLSTCEAAGCGDGHVWAGVEACDDGNADDTDACLSTCEAAGCGDGHVWAGVEACDDGNADDSDACLSTCEAASCGDGHVWEGEEDCDDGDADDGDECPSDCLTPSCQNLLLDGDETGTDCGGSCDACPTGSGCQVDGDCRSGSCQAGVCKDTCTQWIRQFGSSKDDRAFGIAVDPADNVLTVGQTSGELDGNVNAFGNDIVVTKYSPAGTKLWLRQTGTTNSDYAMGVASDAAGNLLVTGATGGSLDGNIGAGGADVFLMKYGPDGTKLWTRQLGTPATDVGVDVAVDSAGDVLVAGHTGGHLDGHVNVGGNDLFILKYDASGFHQWTRTLGSPQLEAVEGIAVDGAGDVLVVGFTQGALDGNVSLGNSDIFVTKHSAAGAKQWTRQFGTNDSDYGYGVAADGHDNVIVVAQVYKAYDLHPYLGGGDVLVVKFDPAGAKVWSRMFGTGAGDEPKGVAIDASNNIYVGGFTTGNLGGSNAGLYDYFVTLYSKGGTQLWSRQRGTNKSDFASDIAVTSFGAPVISGQTDGSFGPPNLGSNEWVEAMLCQP